MKPNKQNMAIELRAIAELQKDIKFLLSQRDSLGMQGHIDLKTKAKTFADLVASVNWDTIAVEIEREHN